MEWEFADVGDVFFVGWVRWWLIAWVHAMGMRAGPGSWAGGQL